MKHDFKWPVISQPIGLLDLDVIGSTLLYVGDGNYWVLASYQDGVWRHANSNPSRLDEAVKPAPSFFLTPADNRDPPSASAGWNCGNGGLMARYALLLIERSRGMSVEQMEWITDLIDRAGPAFTQSRLDFFTAPLDEEVPF